MDTTPDYIVGVAMRLCAERGWRSLRMADIAHAAELDEASLRDVFADKTALLRWHHFHFGSIFSPPISILKTACAAADAGLQLFFRGAGSSLTSQKSPFSLIFLV